MIEQNKEIRDVMDCIYFLWEENEEDNDDGTTYIEENMACVHPDRIKEDCEYLNTCNCKLFEDK